MSACIDLLLEAGAKTNYDEPAVLAVLRGRLDDLAGQLDKDPALVIRRFPELDSGATGGRVLTLRGAPLLHVAAEYGNLEAAKLLLDRGADVNGRATVDEAGTGGRTAIFHAVTQREDGGVPVVQLLLKHRADLSIRVRLPAHYEQPGEVVGCTPLEDALLSPGIEGATVELLRSFEAVE